ncbi:MAG TPA: extracellular solute-binding protein, partial [Lachnospiraceae bacterium]|nr:extracellular solute-binding protein [Lachnospiraceae bacterium]
MKKKLLSALLSAAMVAGLLTGCGQTAETPAADDTAAEASAEEASTDDAAEETAVEETESTQNMADADIDVSALKGTKIAVYTHGGNRVLGEEKKDEDGNTYRDESSAYLTQLAEKFTEETGIEVELNVVTNEDEIEPLFKVQDASVDVFTCPNWSLAQWEEYTEPYCTVEEASEIYGADYAGSMPNNGSEIFSIMPAKAYNQCVVYNEEVIKAAGYDEIPATLDEFNEMCQAIKDMGVTPISLHRVENWPLATVQDFAGYVVGDANVLAECLKEE